MMKPFQLTWLGYCYLLISLGILLFITHGFAAFEHIEQGGDNYWHYTNGLEVVKMLEQGKLFGFYEHGNSGWPMLNVYQPLYYLLSAGSYLALGKSIPFHTIHNLTTVFLLLLSQIGIFYLCRKIGSSVLVSGIASLFGLTFIAGWGSSLETYFNLGMVSFAAGYAFFPFALGKYFEILHDTKLTLSGKLLKNAALLGMFTTATLLGHQIAAYGLFVGFTIITLLKIYRLFFAQSSLLELYRLFKKIALLATITLLMSGFYIIPKLTAYHDFNANSYALNRFTDNVTIGFTTQLMVDKLLSGELLDTTNNLGNAKDTNFRWAYNAESGRPPVLTVLMFLGFILAVFSVHRERSRFLVFMLLFSLILVLGFDDIPLLRFLPLAMELQYLRFIFITNIMAAILAADGLAWISGRVFQLIFEPR